jgi:hypothetical protein
MRADENFGRHGFASGKKSVEKRVIGQCFDFGAAIVRGKNRFVAVRVLHAQTLPPLKTGDFFGAKTAVTSVCAFGFNNSGVFPAFDRSVADAAKTGDFLGGKGF